MRRVRALRAARRNRIWYWNWRWIWGWRWGIAVGCLRTARHCGCTIRQCVRIIQHCRLCLVICFAQRAAFDRHSVMSAELVPADFRSYRRCLASLVATRNVGIDARVVVDAVAATIDVKQPELDELPHKLLGVAWIASSDCDVVGIHSSEAAGTSGRRTCTPTPQVHQGKHGVASKPALELDAFRMVDPANCDAIVIHTQPRSFPSTVPVDYFVTALSVGILAACLSSSATRCTCSAARSSARRSSSSMRPS